MDCQQSHLRNVMGTFGNVISRSRGKKKKKVYISEDRENP